ncbi:MAG: tryptophan synthase subunit alpha [Betaproteobacteria bacterium RIFCSPLOWO2_12_FULL_63_13]|nr:MAG: tryptophan synthase subunit alpha [Betaproteobacteria bacterium RIFCSPLOWO2_12_FULL_63_13]
MSRIPNTFEILRRSGRKALIPFVTAGDPDPAATVPIMHAMVASGADIVELGVPFSDPMADGPVIQRSGERALKHHVGLDRVFAMVREFRDKDALTPLVLMGYANPIEAMGQTEFIRAAREAGVDGVIVVDYPPEECQDFARNLRESGVDLVFLLAPTSTPERIAMITRIASGYIYYVSLRGVTGVANIDLADVGAKIAQIRARTALPVGVGFGIRDGATARAICDIADAAIIGSRIIQEIEAAPDSASERVAAFLSGVRLAMDAR